MSTAGMYRIRDKLMLIAEPGARILFYASFILSIITNFLRPVVAGLFLIRIVTMGIVLSKVSKRLNERYLIFPAFFFDMAAPFINSLFYLSALVNKGKKKPWR